MSLHNLIAQGGRNIASPVERYQQAKAQNQAEQMNRLSMLSTRQSMDINQQKMGMLKQEQDTKIIAPFMKSILEIKDPTQRNAAYQQALPQIRKLGVDTSKAPSQWDDRVGTSIMQAGGLSIELPKAPKTRIVFEGQEKVNQEWQPTTRTWKEVGRGIPSQQTGLPSDFRPTKGGINKVIADRTEANVATNNAINGMQELARIVAKPEWMGGVTGDAISSINSLSSQWKQLTGTNDSVIDENGKIDSAKISPESIKAGWIEKIGRRGAEYKAAVIELAYAKSRAVGNTRITDKDFEFAEKMIAKGGSRESILNNLKLQIERTAKNYNESEKVYQQRYGKQGYKSNVYEIQNSPFTKTDGQYQSPNTAPEINPDAPFDVNAYIEMGRKL